ncbi:MAG: type II secretion system protein [Phycisphaerales bacterium]|nr:type II secretion system protein [Phycisphaerales bacterium]MCB9837445.1 type II secretion system protein [Phycisphaera sp.]
MRARGFTLLETMLAMVVGILVLTAALGVMTGVRSSESALVTRATQQRELADLRVAVSSALTRLRPAPNNIIRQSIPNATDEQLEAILDVPYPDPIDGLPHHFELSDETGKPRLEIVVDRLPMGTYRPDEVEEVEEVEETIAQSSVLTFGDLLGYRGAFELRASQERTAYELWWVPLPPAGLPSEESFDITTLPEPTRLCAHLAEIRWSAFIDSGKVAKIRAVEARQFPAYIELEVRTIDGLYASWMFELGWIPGVEYEAIESDDDSGLDGNGEGEGGGA